LCGCDWVNGERVATEDCPYHTWYQRLNNDSAVAEFLHCSVMDLADVSLLQYNRALAAIVATQKAQKHKKPTGPSPNAPR
jgi:hypothetical protein